MRLYFKVIGLLFSTAIITPLVFRRTSSRFISSRACVTVTVIAVIWWVIACYSIGCLTCPFSSFSCYALYWWQWPHWPYPTVPSAVILISSSFRPTFAFIQLPHTVSVIRATIWESFIGLLSDCCYLKLFDCCYWSGFIEVRWFCVIGGWFWLFVVR